MLQLLITLIQKYEEKIYQIPDGSPHQFLTPIFTENNLKPEDLDYILGSKEAVFAILNGENNNKNITQNQADSLANFFHIDVSFGN